MVVRAWLDYISRPRARRVGLAVFAVSLALASPGRSQSPAPAPARVVTAPLEVRIDNARTVKVLTSILGVELGSALDEAHEKLDPLCAPGTHPLNGEGAADEAKDNDKDAANDSPAAAPKRPGKGDDDDDGQEVLWKLKGTDYSAVFVVADEHEKITAITAFLRPEKQLPFGQVGELAKAPLQDDNSVIWDVLRPDRPLFRVAAKGAHGQASSISLFVVRRNPALHKKAADTKDRDAH